MKVRDFWNTPRTLRDMIHDRSVTFLELFYDLVFVVYIATINHMLLHHFDIDTFAHFLLLFGIGWWAWYSGSMYHDIHGNDDIRSRVFTFIQMFFLIGLIIFAPTTFDEGMIGFSISFIGFGLVIYYLWFMTGVVDKTHRAMSIPFTSIVMISLLFFTAGIFVTENVRFFLWSTCVSINILLPYIAAFVMKIFRVKQTYELEFTQSISERIGLFIIIVTGEILVGVVNGFSMVDKIDFSYLLLGVFCFIIAIFIWWNYFDFLSLQTPKSKNINQNLWSTLHFFLAISISVIGTLITLLFETFHHKEEFVQTLNLVQLFVGITLLLYSLIAFNLKPYKHFARSHQLSDRIVLVLGILLIGFFFIHPGIIFNVISIFLGLTGAIIFSIIYLGSAEKVFFQQANLYL